MRGLKKHPRYAVLLQAATSWTTVNHHPFGLDPVDNRHFLSDMASVSDEDRQKSIARFHGLRSELEALYNKLATIDADRGEHELVIKQMAELEGERRCWHQIGPMLAERRVMDVLPVLRENREQLVSALKLLAETIESREAELSELQKKHHIAETVV